MYKQSEMSELIEKENPNCVMQIHTGKIGKISDISTFTSQWHEYHASGKRLDVSLKPTPRDIKRRELRFRIWKLRIKGREIWHRMGQFFKFNGKSTKNFQTANMQETPRIAEKQS